MSASQRDGAGNQADERILVKQHGHAHTDQVLHDNEHAHNHQKDDQREAALFQAAEIGRKADGGEKRNHESALHIAVKLKHSAGGGIKRADDGGRQQTAGHGFGNVEIAQEFDFAHQ